MKKKNKQSGYYISRYGKICACGSRDTPFDTESFGLINWFATRMTASAIRDIMEENKPRIFLCLNRRIK